MDQGGTRGARIAELQIAGTRGATTLFRVAELASIVTGARYAAVTVVDDDTRWFYAEIGFRREKSALAGALCRLTVEGFAPVVFPDVPLEPRFSGGLIDGAPIEPDFPDLRAYAGVPIVYDNGVAIGTLFVADDAPRPFSDRELTVLQGLAESAVDSFRLVESLQHQQRSVLEAHAQRLEIERSHRELQRTQKHTEMAAELANVGFWSYDVDAAVLQTSPSFRRVSGLRAETVSLEDFVAIFDADAQATFRNNVDVALSSGESFDIELPLAPRAGRKQGWLRTSARVEREPGGRRAPRRLIGCSQDVTEMVQSKQSISKLAMLDTLTGAYNRRFLPLAFLKLLRQTDFETQKVVLMLIDLDHFKFVNDTKGHDAGDAVLKKVTQILRGEVRGGDVVGRIGGDEFMILSAGPAEVDFGAALSSRLIERAARSATLRQHATPVTFSIGYSEVFRPDVEFAEALKAADLAVYEAKDGGRARAVAYHDGLGEKTSRRDQILSKIDAALRSGDIVPVYQPKIGLATGAVVGFEALARWRVDGALRPPAAFLEALEDVHFSRRISDRIFDLAAADAARFKARGLDFGRIAVNATEAQIVDPELGPRLDALCDRHQLRPDELEVEITERALLTRMPEKIKAGLKTLSSRGVHVSFDDFGTGYASLTHLREFDINTIKIDKSFVLSLADDAAAQTITSSLVQMAVNLNLEVVAEGVETAQCEALLKQMGCHIGQGFYYSKPLPIDEAMDFVARRPFERAAAHPMAEIAAEAGRAWRAAVDA